MRPIPLTWKGLMAVALVLLTSLPACILVVDEDGLFDDERGHHGRWRLNVIVYYGRSYTISAAEPYLLDLEPGNRFSGVADCNDYDGRYETNILGSLDVRELYSTDRACRDSIEDLYFESLGNARSYRVESDALTITGSGGDYVLYFYRD